MSESYADIIITQSNADIFSNTLRGDMTIYTERSDQKIHLGTQVGGTAAISIGSNAINASASILPTQHETYDLGALSNAWRDLYLSGTTLYIGGVRVSKNAQANLEVRDTASNLRSLVVDRVQLGEGSNAVMLMKGDAGTGLSVQAPNGTASGFDAASITSGTISNQRLPAASTTLPGIVQLVDSVASTSTTTASTANAAKQAFDKGSTASNIAASASNLAATKVSKAGDTMTGTLIVPTINATNIDFTGALTRNGTTFQSGTPGISNNSSNVFVVAGSNFGIGTATPQAKLHVAGDTLVQGNIEFTGLLTNNGQPFTAGGGSGSVAGFSNFGSNVYTLPFYNLGVGTSNPSSKLHVIGSTRIEGDIALTQRVNLRGVSLSKRTSNNQPYNVTTEITHPQIQATPSTLGFALSNQQTAFNFLNSNGAAVASISSTGTIDFTGALRQNGVPFQSGTQGLSNNSSNVFVISGSNFGVGTSIPQALLHVAGTTRVDGDFQLNNSYVSLRGVRLDKRTANNNVNNISTIVTSIPSLSNTATTLNVVLSSNQSAYRFVSASNTELAQLNASGLTVNGTQVSLTGHTHDASAITTGTLGVARGGTGTTTSTGTGSVVLNNAPTFTGIVSAATINATTLQQGGVGVTVIGHTHDASAITTGTLATARLPVASTTAQGIVQLNDTVASTSTALAATANAVKVVNDNANTKLPLSGGTLTGSLTVRRGNPVNDFTANQYTLEFGIGGYAHAIKTRHDATINGVNNAIDLYVWQTTDGMASVGTKHVMSATSAGVGIFNAYPTQALDVVGSAKVSAQVLGNLNDTTTAPSYSWNGDNDTGMYHASDNSIGFACGGTSMMTLSNNGLRINQALINPIGNAPFYGVRAWVIFDGTIGGTNAAQTIRASSNVASVTRVNANVGDYYITFSIPMPTNSYVISGCAFDTTSADPRYNMRILTGVGVSGTIHETPNMARVITIGADYTYYNSTTVQVMFVC